MSSLLFKLLMGKGGGGGGGPTPTLNLDLTSSLDSKITFTRAGTRNYINNGVLTALATGTPAFESWDGMSRGMAIEPAFTNLLTYSNDFANAAWVYTGSTTAVAGDSGSGVMSQLSMVAATATSNYHQIKRISASLTAGSRHTWQGYIKASAGSTNYSAYLRMSNQYNNAGLFCAFRLDGNEGFFPVQDLTMVTDGVFGYRKLTGGVYHVWLTGTWVSTGVKELIAGVTANANTVTRNYAGAVTDKVQVYGFSLVNTSAPTGYVETVASTASQAAESAVFNDTAWLTTAQGTFIVEHDCWSGPIVGSGANTVLAATTPGKTAIAWSGVTSDTVVNGGSAASGSQPAFSGSDVRLLATTGATNAGHIKAIKFYPTRLSVAELQALTAPTVVSTAQPGVLRTVSVDNRLPAENNVTTGTALTFKSRYRLKLGAHACSELRLDFPNIQWAGKAAVGNALNVTSVALERVTDVAESVPVKVLGSRSFTIADGANTTVVSDALVPSDFTGLTEFPANTEFWVRLEGSVSTAGHIVVGCRQVETDAFAKLYNPATVTYSPVDGVGPMALLTGTNVSDLTQGYCPILVGKFSSGDPKTIFVAGDSIIEGTGSLGRTGTFIKLAAVDLGVPQLEMSRGGESQVTAAPGSATWTPYMKYARVLVDEFGTNNVNAVMDFFTYWNPAKKTYGMDKIVRVGLFPRTNSSDSYATEANQTVSRAYPLAFPDLANIEWLKYGAINYNVDPQSVRGVDKAKWISNGTAFYGTPDGTHQSNASNDLLKAEFQPILAAITVS